MSRVLLGGAAFLALWLIVGQTPALLDYAWAVAWGFQESAHAVTPVGVAFNKGFALADTVVYLPLLLLGLGGMSRDCVWGAFAMFGAMAMTPYWALACLTALVCARGAPDWHFAEYSMYVPVLLAVAAFGARGMRFVWVSQRDNWTALEGQLKAVGGQPKALGVQRWLEGNRQRR